MSKSSNSLNNFIEGASLSKLKLSRNGKSIGKSKLSKHSSTNSPTIPLLFLIFTSSSPTPFC
ncbi:hypothetical protein Syun_019292 [Stephania yunnanensis]|uniref:Uncharacterized protein n=1 Tax=Stephania yunnanensis TaxID=152371 RepID=A0AAP0NXU6_9MAGN